MTFAYLASLLEKLGPLLPAFLALLNQVIAALQGVQADNPAPTSAHLGNLKMKVSAPVSMADKAVADRLALSAGGMDGSKIAAIFQFLMAHPDLLMWALKMFGAPVPKEVSNLAAHEHGLKLVA